MVRKPSSLPDSCFTKYVKLNHYIDTNSWIFETTTDNVIIKCRNRSEPLELSIVGTGILSLDYNCEANTDDGTMLIAKRIITSKLYKDFIPKLNTSIISQFEINSTKINADNLFPIKKSIKLRNNLNKLSENAKSLDELSAQLDKTPYAHTIQVSIKYLYLIIIEAIVSIGLIVFKIIL